MPYNIPKITNEYALELDYRRKEQQIYSYKIALAYCIAVINQVFTDKDGVIYYRELPELLSEPSPDTLALREKALRAIEDALPYNPQR